MKIRFWLWAAMLFFSLGTAAAQVQANKYVIGQGDTLSCIAEKFVGYPVYGQGGSIELLQSLNTWLADPHIIPRGQLIALPPQEQRATYAKIDVPTPACAGSQSRYANDQEMQALHQKIDRLEAKIDKLQQWMEQRDIASHAPSVQLTTVAAETAPSLNVFYADRRYYLGLGFLYHRIDGRDTVNNSSANVLSDPSWQLEMGWKTPMRFNDRYFTHIHTHVQYYRYSKDLPGSTVADQSIFAPGVHLGVGKSWWENRLQLEGYTGIDREFYFFTSNLNSIEFDADWIGKVGLEFDLTCIKKAKFNAGLRGQGEILGLGGFLDDGGWHAGGDVYLGYKQHELRVGFVYGNMSSTNAAFDTYETNLVYKAYF